MVRETRRGGGRGGRERERGEEREGAQEPRSKIDGKSDEFISGIRKVFGPSDGSITFGRLSDGGFHYREIFMPLFEPASC